MAISAKRLIDGSLLVAALAAYYTAPANTRAVVKRMVLMNTTAGAVVCAVHLVPPGGTANGSNKVFGRTLSPGESQTVPEAEGQVIEATGFISAAGDGVTLTASGVEIT